MKDELQQVALGGATGAPHRGGVLILAAGAFAAVAAVAAAAVRGMVARRAVLQQEQEPEADSPYRALRSSSDASGALAAEALA